MCISSASFTRAHPALPAGPRPEHLPPGLPQHPRTLQFSDAGSVEKPGTLLHGPCGWHSPEDTLRLSGVSR